MACFDYLHSLAYCFVLFLLNQTFASPVIEAFKLKRNGEVTQNRMKMTKSAYVKDFSGLNKMMKSFEDKIDNEDVRRKIMEAQMKYPFAFSSSRMAAALQFINTEIPSIIYNDSTIASGNGILLQIFDDGTVNGTMDLRSPYAKLTLESIGSGGVYRIKGTKSQRYLVYKRNGRVMAESGPPTYESIFRSKKSARLDSIQSVAYGWYLGFRHNFRMKKGPHVRLRHKGSQFAVIARIG